MAVGAFGQTPSALNRKEFARHWVVESESADYRVTFRGDTADIVSPKGLTLWRKEKMKGRVTIEYDACVVVEDGSNEPTNRLSDLNRFWMASDPKYPDDIFRRMKERGGVFLMEKVLFATDELTGLIWAAALMRPSKSVQDMELKSLKKKYKSKGFAAGCSREVIEQGAEMLGWLLDEVLQKTLDAMRDCEAHVSDEMQAI